MSVSRKLPGTINGSPLIEGMQYNELGQLTKKRDFRGYWTSFEYDVRGRLKAKTPDAGLVWQKKSRFSISIAKLLERSVVS